MYNKLINKMIDSNTEIMKDLSVLLNSAELATISSKEIFKMMALSIYLVDLQKALDNLLIK